jgi:hypothetical protein
MNAPASRAAKASTMSPAAGQAPGAARALAGHRTRGADRQRTAPGGRRSGAALSAAVMDTTEMLACAPAFDLLPMVKAQTRGCVLLRSPQAAGDSQIIGVIADPFDSDCMVWLSSLAGTPVHYCLALAADIQAYLSKHEESVHAVQSLVHDRAAPERSRTPRSSVSRRSAKPRARRSSWSTRPSMTRCGRRRATSISRARRPASPSSTASTGFSIRSRRSAAWRSPSR